MQTSNIQKRRSNEDMVQFPSYEEVDLQVAKARQARSAFLHQLVVGTLAAFDRRFHQTSTATN